MSKTPASDVDLNRVAVFLRVVELQSFTAAAEVLGLPKSSVSRSVARLEESLGVQLLQRTTRAIQLTEAGRLYFEQASRALSELEQAHETLSQLDARPQGAVRITAPSDLGAQVLAPLAARFVRRTPGITLEFLLTGRLVNLVEEGVDLAVRAGPMRDSSLISRRVSGLDAWLFASRREGFGLPIVEGMASGVPVVASNVCSIPEVGGDAILTFDPTDLDDIVAAAERALFDGPTRALLVERGTARAASFTWSEAARRTASVYRELLNPSAKKGHGSDGSYG